MVKTLLCHAIPSRQGTSLYSSHSIPLVNNDKIRFLCFAILRHNASSFSSAILLSSIFFEAICLPYWCLRCAGNFYRLFLNGGLS